MNWMVRWAGRFPVFVTEAKGAHFRCVDGHDYIDFCLGDTGAMTGHAPEAAMFIRQPLESILEHDLLYLSKIVDPG